VNKECPRCKFWRDKARIQAGVVRRLKKRVNSQIEIFFAMVKINVDAKEKASRK
jgi:hypothetical protein